MRSLCEIIAEGVETIEDGDDFCGSTPKLVEKLFSEQNRYI